MEKSRSTYDALKVGGATITKPRVIQRKKFGSVASSPVASPLRKSALTLASPSLVSLKKPNINDILKKSKLAPEDPSSMPFHFVKIRIESNWGNPQFVSCSQVAVLSARKMTIPVQAITSEPVKQTLEEMSKLVNGTLIKKDAEDCWKAQWPPEPPLTSFDIVLRLRTNEIVEAIRFWPVEHDPTQNIRNVTIYLNQDLMYQGELESDFGNVIPLRLYDDDGNLVTTHKTAEDHQIIDVHGIMPVRPANILSIEAVSSYASQDEFGLMNIRLYDRHGEYLDVRKNSLIEAEGCGDNGKSAAELFYDPKEPSRERRKLWKGQLTPESRIVVKFQEKVQISAIAISTLRPMLGPVDIGLKVARVKINGVQRWAGLLKRGADEANPCTTVAFLADNRNVYDRIMKDVFIQPVISTSVYAHYDDDE